TSNPPPLGFGDADYQNRPYYGFPTLQVYGGGLLGPVDELTYCDEGCCDMNKGLKRYSELVVAGRDASELLELAHEALDPVAAAITPLPVGDLKLPAGVGWDHRLDPPLGQQGADRVAVEGPVRQRPSHAAPGRHGVQDLGEGRGVAPLAGRERHRDGAPV